MRTPFSVDDLRARLTRQQHTRHGVPRFVGEHDARSDAPLCNPCQIDGCGPEHPDPLYDVGQPQMSQ